MKLREACRKNFLQVSSKSPSVTPSSLQNTFFNTVFVLPKFSTMELKHMKFEPQIRILRETSSLEPSRLKKSGNRNPGPNRDVLTFYIKISFHLFLVSLKDLRSETLSEGRGNLELLHVQRLSKTDCGIPSYGLLRGYLSRPAVKVLTRTSCVFAMFGPNLGVPDVSSWLYTQSMTSNPILQPEITNSFRETRKHGCQKATNKSSTA